MDASEAVVFLSQDTQPLPNTFFRSAESFTGFFMNIYFDLFVPMFSHQLCAVKTAVWLPASLPAPSCGPRPPRWGSPRGPSACLYPPRQLLAPLPLDFCHSQRRDSVEIYDDTPEFPPTQRALIVPAHACFCFSCLKTSRRIFLN